MKLIILIPNGWPEKKKVEDTFYGDCEQADKLGYNECLASLDPIKNVEIALDKDSVKGILLQADLDFHKLDCADDEFMEWIDFMAEAVAANLDKILVVKKGEKSE